MLPTFLYIGPDKAGSTWIFEALRQHPEVYVATSKDIYFFDRYFDRGLDWYESHFADGVGKRAVGEISHDYLFSEEACERIAACLPNVKLLVNLRNPIERAFSEYLYLMKHDLTREGFRRATEQFPSILTGGRYTQHLEHYLRRFPRRTLLVQIFDKLKSEPNKFVSDLYDFLNVDRHFKPSNIGKRSLSAARPRIPILARWAKSSSTLLRDLGLGRVVGRLKFSGLINDLLFVPYSEHDAPRLTTDDLQWLRNIYYPEVRALERLLGERFDAWLED